MRGRRHVAVAVRRPDGQIAVRTEPIGQLYLGRLRRFPFLRGLLALVEMLSLGSRALLYSANVALGKDESAGSAGMLWGMLVPALALGVGLFFLLPVLAVRLLDEALGSPLASNLAEGGIRLALFLGYLWLISRAKDIRRVFAYHGAEHKTIHAHEAGVPLEPRQVQRFSTAHPRCGTSFLLAVVVVSILVFALLGTPPLWLRLLSRVLLLPAIAGASYEIIRLGAAHGRHGLLEWLRWPGLALQALTTREPGDDQVEVAIQAFTAVVQADAAGEAATTPQTMALGTPGG
ncbi:MAG: DUF1385 domain-containing protein [Chloroflexi bacterium]|nr:DUF1385 domain-containing protein [Chloroflexota bacterium]